MNTPNSGIDGSSDQAPANASSPQYDPTMPLLRANDQYLAARSRHAGGVNVSLCDGSVRFFSYAAGTTTIISMSTRAMGEVVTE